MYIKTDKVIYYTGHNMETELENLQKTCQHLIYIKMEVKEKKVNECFFCGTKKEKTSTLYELKGNYTDKERQDIMNRIRAKYDSNTAPTYNVNRKIFTKERIAKEIEKAINEVVYG